MDDQTIMREISYSLFYFSLEFLEHINMCWYVYFLWYKMMSCKTKDMQWFADILATISQANRLQIICLLATKWELCVCKITELLSLKQNLISHHLNVLKDIWLLITRREGKNVFYMLEKKSYQNIKSSLKNIFSL